MGGGGIGLKLIVVRLWWVLPKSTGWKGGREKNWAV